MSDQDIHDKIFKDMMKMVKNWEKDGEYPVHVAIPAFFSVCICIVSSFKENKKDAFDFMRKALEIAEEMASSDEKID